LRSTLPETGLPTNGLRPRAGKAIQQFSFVDALVAGLFDGAFDAATVVTNGTLGVGCGDALDGELVLLDDTFVVCRADGISSVEPQAAIPFAEVVDFEPTFTLSLDGPLTEAEFEALVDGLVPSHNLFYAIRLDGEFESITVREAVRQQKPYRGLADAVGDQHETTCGATAGTLLGFKGPDVFQGLSVADYHLHYLASDRSVGGHSMDFVLRRGTLTMEAYASFTVHLPQVDSYLEAELDDISADEAIRSAESQ
jgi:acetolactate decarboxylase